jgi:ribosomal protein S27E
MPRSQSAKPQLSNLELQAVLEWRLWGSGYALHTRCDGCGEQKMCRGRKRRHMLCLECFDTGETKK